MQILGGVVRYEDGIKTTQGDQFSPTRKVAVELNFTLDPTDANGSTDPAIQTVLDKAQAFVNAKLSLQAPTLAAKTELKQATAPLGTTAAENTKKVKTPAAPKTPATQVDLEELTSGDTGKTKADLAKEAGVNKKIKGKNEDDLELTVKPAEKPAEAEVEKPKPADDISDLLGSTAPPISDGELNDLAQKAMVRINTQENPGGPRIRKLVAEFLPEDAQPVLAKIAQDKRAEFAKKLGELK